MSTKTLRKRISLVAVSALTFGLISAIAPSTASAAEATVTEITAVAIATPSGGRVGSPFTSAVTYTIAGDDTDSITLRALLSVKPAGSTAAVGFNEVGSTVASTTAITQANASGNELLPIKIVTTNTSAQTDGTYTVGRVGITPDLAGTYTITVWHDQDEDGTRDSDEDYSTKDFVVGAAPTTITMTAINSRIAVGGSNGSLVKVTLPAGTALAADEQISFSVSATGATIARVNDGGSAATTQTLTSADFSNNVAWLNITDSTGASTVVVTAAGVGTGVASLSGTLSLTSVVVDTSYTSTISLGCGTDNSCAGWTSTSEDTATDADTSTAGSAGPDYTVPLGAGSSTWTVTATAGLAAADYVFATVTDVSGKVLGVTTPLNLDYDLVATAAAGTVVASSVVATFTVARSFSAADQQYIFTWTDGTTTNTSEMVGDTSDLTNGAVTYTNSTINVKTGSSVPLTATVTNQFGDAVANAVVTWSVAGRNATTTATQTTATTNADGVSTFTLADAPAAGVVSVTDTVTALAREAGNTATADATINWSVTGPVASTVTLVTPTYASATSNDTVLKTTTYTDIAAGATGAQAGGATVTATVKDAAGNLLAYMPVTFTVSGTTGAAVKSTTATVYTGAAGTAAATVYGWTAGTYTVTATAGTVSGTGTINFAQTTLTEARKITAAVSGSLVTATVTDRFGNPIKGVRVYGTAVGAGYFGSGTRATSGDSNASGVVEFILAGGDATVTVQLTDPTGTAQSYGQSGDAADKVGTTAVTASAAGTALTAETGVGAAFAAAGVNAATVSVVGNTAVLDTAQAATDAAAEATDAANAATDAANAAAEAADAATAQHKMLQMQ